MCVYSGNIELRYCYEVWSPPWIYSIFITCSSSNWFWFILSPLLWKTHLYQQILPSHCWGDDIVMLFWYFDTTIKSLADTMTQRWLYRLRMMTARVESVRNGLEIILCEMMVLWYTCIHSFMLLLLLNKMSQIYSFHQWSRKSILWVSDLNYSLHISGLTLAGCGMWRSLFHIVNFYDPGQGATFTN